MRTLVFTCDGCGLTEEAPAPMPLTGIYGDTIIRNIEPKTMKFVRVHIYPGQDVWVGHVCSSCEKGLFARLTEAANNWPKQRK